MQTKHTPGPWKALGYSIVKRSRRFTIADTYMQSGNSAVTGVEVTKANAALISAAPDLLEACQLAEEMLTTTGTYPDLLKFIQQAIAKAEGGAR